MKYFNLSEFDSPDHPGSGTNMDGRFLEMLDNAREIYGRSMRINSDTEQFTKIKKSAENQIQRICKESRRTYIATIPATVTIWSRHSCKPGFHVWGSEIHSFTSIVATYIQTKTQTSFGHTNTTGSTLWIRNASKTPTLENSF